MASQTSPKPPAETVPDPDEDDLDDLDDVLDEFDSKPTLPSQPKPTSTSPPPSSSGPGRPAAPGAIDDVAQHLSETAITDEDDPELAAQLQKGMTDLIAQLGENPDMQKQFEDMMQELIAAGAAPTDEQAAEHIKRASESVPKDPDEKKAGAAAGAQDSFQDTIKRTMQRMQESGDAATAASTSAAADTGSKSEEEFLAELMKSLGSGEDGEGGEEDFNSLLLSMMSQLTHKDILYEPMKDLSTKYPAWLKENEGKVGKEDFKRYQEQEKLVREIVARFEKNGYSDEDERDREYIVQRMQKMQAAGSPPPDLVGDMNAAQEALGELDQGCPTQ